jgi:FAD:protein FMN transferase
VNQVRRARPTLGTIAQITVQAPLPLAQLQSAVNAAFAEIALVHSLMSWHDPDSELSRLNRDAADSVQPVHSHTRNVLEAALKFARLSAGAFDPCVAGCLARWGLLPSPASPTRSSKLPADTASWADVELSAQGVRFHRPLWLDLGGIAKGYAVDLAIEHLLRLGISEIVVNAGGDLRVAGARPHSAGIRHPQRAHDLVHELSLTNEALATSSGFESRRMTAQGPVCALVDPATGRAYAGHDSVSVRAASCMSADALTKVALFAPASVAERVFESCHAHCIRLQSGGRCPR